MEHVKFTGVSPIYIKEEMADIIKQCLDALNERAESLQTDEEIEAAIQKWVQENT